MPAVYTVHIGHSAQKHITALSKPLQKRITTRLLLLQSNPYEQGEKLEGAEDLYRIRIGDYRAIYQVKDRELIVLVLRVGHRGDVYRQLPRVE